MHLFDGLGRTGDGYPDLDGIVHDRTRHATDVIRHGSGEEDGLAVLR